MDEKWKRIAGEKLPEEISYLGTEGNRRYVEPYSVEEVLASENLWWFRHWAESIMVASWPVMVDAVDDRLDPDPAVPANIDEVEVAFDVVFLGHVPERLERDVLDVLSRCRSWNLGGSTGVWTRWAEKQLADAGFDKGEHPLEQLYGILSPVSEIWSAYLEDACLFPGAVIVWTDEHRIEVLKELGRMLGIDTAIEAYMEGIPLEHLLIGKRSYELDGSSFEL